jgi:hypothetical protein
MPRNGRIELVGKREAREAEAREDELRDLTEQLRQERQSEPVPVTFANN